jgi:hypothetical protein
VLSSGSAFKVDAVATSGTASRRGETGTKSAVITPFEMYPLSVVSCKRPLIQSDSSLAVHKAEEVLGPQAVTSAPRLLRLVMLVKSCLVPESRHRGAYSFPGRPHGMCFGSLCTPTPLIRQSRPSTCQPRQNVPSEQAKVVGERYWSSVSLLTVPADPRVTGILVIGITLDWPLVL